MIILSTITFIIGILFTGCGLSIVSKINSDMDFKRKAVATSAGKFCAIMSAICFALTLLLPIGIPEYTVWQQNKEGEAELARAEQNRKIAVEEAKAKEESAKSLANAEIIRAQGVAQANKIIGDSLQNNDAYIHYLWIDALRESSNEVIYIPTEAGIPITESTRFFRRSVAETEKTNED